MTRLWETDHPYYCTEGNYYVGGYRWHEVHTEYESWAEFIDDWGETDHDMNLVFRWDWVRADPEDYPEEEPPGDVLRVFWVLQRKAILRSTECAVTEADEPAIREWLTKRAERVRMIWEPLLDGGAS